MADRSVVVCDNGTGFVKCGFAGDNFPREVFPCMVGRSTNYEEGSKVVVGEECRERRYELEVSYPVSEGGVQDWDEMRHIWDHTFKDVLKVCQLSYALVVLTALRIPNDSCERRWIQRNVRSCSQNHP